MKISQNLKDWATIALAIVILSIATIYLQNIKFYIPLICFSIIVLANVFTKKIVAYFFETSIQVKFWQIYYYWFRKDSHFKEPIPMAWLPLILTLVSKGFIWWFGILEFDMKAKAERAAKRHGLYRFTEITEWHMAVIAAWGVVINLALAIIGYLIGFEFFTKLNIYYAIWAMVPISNLDGSKILFGSKPLWIALALIVLIFFIGAIII